LMASADKSVRQAMSFAIRNQPPNAPGRCILQEVSTHLMTKEREL
jgi:hypothetical protein